MLGYVCNEFFIVDVVLHNYLCSIAIMLGFCRCLPGMSDMWQFMIFYGNGEIPYGRDSTIYLVDG
jgi:hypothetical protein